MHNAAVLRPWLIAVCILGVAGLIVFLQDEGSEAPLAATPEITPEDEPAPSLKAEGVRKEPAAAKALTASHANRLEPDGAPGPSGEPRSSTHGNIDYHLALAHYLRGEFARSAELWLGCVQNWAKNDDSRIAALHFFFLGGPAS